MINGNYDAYIGRYVYLCGNENRVYWFSSIIMAKELIRVPRILGGNCNSGLIERLYEAGGNVMLLDLIIYLSSHHLTDLFGTSWFSVEDFCHKRGHNNWNSDFLPWVQIQSPFIFSIENSLWNKISSIIVLNSTLLLLGCSVSPM